MKPKFLPVFFLFCLSLQSSQAQRSCCFSADFYPANWVPITISAIDTPPDGLPDDVSCSCLTGEGSSTWFSFSATSHGTFELLITPNVAGDNFDFALWEGNCPCNSTSPTNPTDAVSCNGAVGPGPTGIATDPMASFGVPGSAEFSPTIMLSPGKNYFLMITNRSSNKNGFTVLKGGSASIGSQILTPNPGEVTGPPKVCPGGDAVFTLDPPLSGPNNYIWVIKQGGVQINITQNGPSPTQSLNFPYPPGTYTVCVSASNFFISCFPWAEKCTTIEVVEYPVPAAFESATFCTNEAYAAANGDVFNAPGTYDLLYHTLQGCDSIVRLTLTQKPTNLVHTLKEVCAGECVDWGGESYCETGVYDEILQNQFGCDSVNQLILISVPIETKINGADTLDCITTSLTLTSAGSIYAANPVYIWKKGNTVVGNGPNLTITTGGTYTLQINSIVSGKTCTDIATVNIVQNTMQPQGVVATGGSITCIQSQATLMGSSTTPNVTYHWTGPNGFVSNQQNPTVNVQGNYVLTVTGTNGCTKTATAVVAANVVPPTAIAAANGTLNCNVSSLLLNGTGSSQGSQFAYLWTTLDGSILANETTLTPTINKAGNYVLTVTNTVNGCSATATTTVIQLPPVTSQITDIVNIACFGETSGSATVAASGGNGSFTYEWSNGQTGTTATNLLAGNYNVVVTDGNGCTSSESVAITQPMSVVANASATPQTVFNVNDGTAMASPSGGIGPYSYLWNNGETTAIINDLAPGNYTVTVTDSNNCTASQTVTVSASNCIVKANTDQTNVSCPGAGDGAASINLENASPPFGYVWSNGATTQTITGLDGGTYDVSVTDGNGCEVVATVIIEEPLPLTPNATATDLTASNANDGTASATPTGGTVPYTFIWSNGEPSETIIGLAPGDYTVIITDANGCESEQTVTVNPFTCSLSANIIVGNISCNNADDGQATVSLVGASGTIIYAWSNGDSTATISDLSAGVYSATATDESGCIAVAEVILTAPNPLGMEIVEQIEPACNTADGSLTIMGTEGTPGYSYLWQSGENTQTITGLSTNTYTVTITDANDCTQSFDIPLGTNDNIPPDVAVQNITLVLDADGQASISPSDVDNGSTDDCIIASLNLDQTNFDCEAVGENTVTLSVTDAGGNTANATAIVTVVDNSAPVLVLQDIALNIGLNGTAVLTPQLVDNGSTDNCGIVEWTFSQSIFDCNDAGPQTVEVTATDDSGNSTTGMVTVMVTENTPPTINCPTNMVLPYCNPVAIFDVTAIDNCVGAVNLTQTSGTPSGSTYPIGNTTVAFTASDISGNTANCSFVINVPPTMTVGANAVDVKCFGENDGSAMATPSGGLPPYTYLWSNGAITQSANGLEAGSYSVSVTDASGCTVIQEVTVSEPSNLTSTLVSIINANLNEMNGSVDVSVSGGTMPYTYQWKNTNGQIIGNAEDIDGLAAGTYSLLIIDANGCQSQSFYTIQTINATTQIDTEGQLILYPNPTSNWAVIEVKGMDNMERLKVSIFDVTGKLVRVQQGAGNQMKLDFSDMPSAVYFLKISVGNKSVIKKLVVNK